MSDTIERSDRGLSRKLSSPHLNFCIDTLWNSHNSLLYQSLDFLFAVTSEITDSFANHKIVQDLIIKDKGKERVWSWKSGTCNV